MSIQVGDRVKANKNYYEVCSPAEVAAAEQNGGLFGEVVDVDGNVLRVRWAQSGFSRDYDVAFAHEVEKVST